MLVFFPKAAAAALPALCLHSTQGGCPAPKASLGTNPFPAALLPGAGDWSSGWRGQGEPAQLLLRLHLIPVVLHRGDPRNTPPARAGICWGKGTFGVIAAWGGPCPWLSHSLFVLIWEWGLRGQVLQDLP